MISSLTASAFLDHNSITDPTGGWKTCQKMEFHKVNCAGFKQAVTTATKDLPTPNLSNINSAYEAYCNVLLEAAKKKIPRGFRKPYVPCWDEECEDLLQVHDEAQSPEHRRVAANAFLGRLDEKRKERWTETVESIIFTHSSRRA